MVSKEIVIIGASSELAASFIELCSTSKYRVTIVTRSNNLKPQIKEFNYIFVKDYLEDLDLIKKKLISMNNSIIIYFNGVLYENRPIKYPTENEIQLTEDINFKIPYNLCKELDNTFDKIEKHVFISSMAAVVDRNKNFIYGQSKRKLESSINNLNLNSFLIFRFGKIHTKMSENHKNPPLSLSKEKAAELIYNNLHKEGIQYPLAGLKIISFLLKLIPKSLFKIIKL